MSMRQDGFSWKEAHAMQGRLVRTMRPVYDVGAGELGVVCGMYLVSTGYAITVRFSDASGQNKSFTYTFDWHDAMNHFYEIAGWA